jgi:site-specific DNA recombinase
MYRRGLRNRNGGAVTINGLATILKNPFYIGLMQILKTGQTFKGVHEPLISPALFEKAQAVLAGKRVDRALSHIFTYSRIVRCASCNYSLIAERQKGHVYYRCHDRPFKNPAVCPATSIREEQIENAVLGMLTRVTLSEKELAVAREVLAHHRAELEERRTQTKNTLRLQYDQLRNRISKLADLLLDGAIEKSLFESKQRALLLEQAAVEEKLKELESGSDAGLAELEKTVELAKDTSSLYKTASAENKRKLLKILLSNLTVSGKNVIITLSIPFRVIAERENNDDCRLNRGTCRTWAGLIRKLYAYFNENVAARNES